MNGKHQQLIISVLNKHYGFQIFEFCNPYSNETYWGVKREGDGFFEFIIFSSFDDLGEIKRSFSEHVAKEVGYNKIIKCSIIIIGEKVSEKAEFQNLNGFRTYEFRESYIVIDIFREAVEYCDPEAEELARVVSAVIANSRKINEEKLEKSSKLTTIIIIINIIVFLVSCFLSGSFIDIDTGVLVFLGAKQNELIAAGEYYRLFTAMFLHGGIVHIGFNMYALYSLGPLVEKIYGKYQFIVIYIISGLTSSYASYLFSDSVSVGASGAIFGLLGAALVFGFKMKRMGNRDFLKNIAQVIIINLFLGFTLANIDNFGHLGGLAGGLITTYLLGLKKGK